MTAISSSFANGDFSPWASTFQQAGFSIHQPCAGVIQICSPKPNANRLRLLISVGIHGDETAPIEMIALLLDELSKTPSSLAVDLMVAVGNLPAIKEAKRFIETDLNRLFTPQRTTLNNTQEAKRADQLMQAATQFFDGHQHKWHLDLHTAIRASVYSTFAIVPGKHHPNFVSWLGAAGIKAVVQSPKPSVTFSSYTCAHLGAVSCTAELGRIGQLGKNDLSRFATTESALHALLRSETNQHSSDPDLFCVAQELIKHSDAFQFIFDSNTQNFTEFPSRAVLARDGNITYSVGATPEYILFPNPDVRIGLRAGLTVKRVII